ncbi:DUF192 domain-containing protein [[Limnothrix rosea] IAM M-220]|uniref:DUF192 domain-containing protein n=1 Tax=[Limnothrix rosea] IAM M-220 TaxID=454133 RepID=UPI000965BCAD|nr:DUF192 domain-containing protein [[Limnothrix rosea] IAM M-220]OKH10922.1 hypothetical protein NIES208_17985 [[Limnothrix rosea] IAM M-220]
MTLPARLLPLLCGVLLVGCVPFPGDGVDPSTTPGTTPPPEITTPVPTTPQGQVLPITATAKIESSGQIFALEVAETAEQQQLGLMYRESLPDNRGMLFQFDPARPVSFWMKNCLIHLDIIFLKDGVVQTIARNVPPCENDPCPTYGTPADIDQVIEIRGGLSDEMGLTEGDEITVSFMDS